jgi:hypothetical protein
MTKTNVNDQLRKTYTAAIMEALAAKGEEVMQVGTNQIAFPCVDANGDDSWIEITIKVPTGSRDGDAYDGYAMAEDFQIKQRQKAEKAEKTAAAKEKKIAADKAKREQLAAQKLKRQNQ